MSKILEHLASVRTRATGLHTEKALVFCLLCAERQKFAYDKAVSVVREEDARLARELLDSLWRREAPAAELPLIVPTFDAEDAAANFVYTTHCLILIETASPEDSCGTVAELALNTADSLAYSLSGLPVGRASDKILFERDLLQEEVRHQEHDLALLEGLTVPLDLVVLKASARGDITLGQWFAK